jgi:hypothetical protein
VRVNDFGKIRLDNADKMCYIYYNNLSGGGHIAEVIMKKINKTEYLPPTRVTVELKQKLRIFAEQHMISVSQVIRDAIIKYIGIILIAFLAGCGGGGSSSQPVQYTSAVQDVTIKGDSMAIGCNEFGCGNTWWLLLPKNVENDGQSGVPIQYLLDNPDHRHLKTVILFIGFNDAKHPDETEAGIIYAYGLALSQITADKIICIGIPPMNHALSDAWYPEGAWIANSRISNVNEGIRSLCPNYIDTSDLTTVDGIHPSTVAYQTIVQRLIAGGI